MFILSTLVHLITIKVIFVVEYEFLMVVSMSNTVKYVMVLSSILLFLHTILGFYNTNDIFNDIYIYGEEFDRFSSPMESTEESIIHFIDMPLNITVLEEKNNRIDEDISNSTELTSDTAFKQEEFRRDFCGGINSTTSESSEYVVEYMLPRDCEM